jgi:predicted ATPase/class 3 adenylate cyclase
VTVAVTRPQGTVTLMFTDIAGSTALLRELGDRYADELREHRRLMREVFERHHGAEIDTQGDAFFAAFSRASDAVAAAIEAGVRHGGGRVRVRIGIHTGEPALSDLGYVGMDVHRAARISAAASAGQVLLSQQTRELVELDDIRDLGVHRLKDVGELRLYQLGDERFPPIRSIALTNLPESGAAPVGREQELDDLAGMIEAGDTRLVTVSGAGGIGKTTIARALAGRVRDRFPDGVWFVDLSQVSDRDGFEPALAATLGSRATAAEHLRDQVSLLVLDNFEQILPAAPAVAELIEICPGLVLVVTSREALRLRGEHEYPLASLPDLPAVTLFRRRAQALVPGFQAGDEELAELCRRLDGLPLAIELAAARVKLLTAEQLHARLDQRFALLTGGARDLPARQRTLEATIDWSYQLLDAKERALFAQLSVFAGDWTLEAAESVCLCSVDAVQSLVDKSLVDAGSGRLRMLESIHAYAAARLAELGGEQQLRRRHAAHYAALVERAEPELIGSDPQQAVDALSADYDNIRAAIEWCLHEGAGGEALRIASRLGMFWFLRSMYGEGIGLLERAIEANDSNDQAALAGALWSAGLMLTLAGDLERSRMLLDRGYALAEGQGDDSMVARYLDILGLHAFFDDDPQEACRLLERSIERAQAAGDHWCLADALGTIGSIYPLIGEHQRAVAAGSQSLSIARSNRDLQGTRMALFGLALNAVRVGRLDTAGEASREGLEISRPMGDLWFVSYFLWTLSTASRLSGDAAAARRQADESLAVARELAAPLLLVCALEAQAAAARDQGDRDAAEAALREAETIGRAGGVPGSYLAEALRAAAELAWEAGDRERALGLAEESRALADHVGDPWVQRRVADLLERFLPD